jgi:hypothetical protein
MVKEDLETVIDRLLDFVRTNKSCSLTQASKALALNPSQVERLALLLEESDLLEVQYTIWGINLLHREQEEEKKEELKEKAREKANAILVQTQALEKEVATSEHMIAFMHKDIAKRLDNARGILSSLEKKRDYTQAEIAFARREIGEIKKELKSFNAGLKELKAKHDQFEAELNKFANKLVHVRVVGKRKPGIMELLLASIPFIGKKKEAKPLVEKKEETAKQPEKKQEAKPKKRIKKGEGSLSSMLNQFRKKWSKSKQPKLKKAKKKASLLKGFFKTKKKEGKAIAKAPKPKRKPAKKTRKKRGKRK